MKRFFSLFLAIMMVMGLTLPAMAEEIPEAQEWCGNSLCSQEDNTHGFACDQYVRSYEECKCAENCAVEGLNEYCETCYFDGVEACAGKDTSSTMDANHNCTLDADNWTPLTKTSGTLSAGNYYLTGDLNLTGGFTISGTVNLCLNGKTIDAKGYRVFYVPSGATLNLTDCGTNGTITGAKKPGSNTENPGGSAMGIYGGTVNMYGGTISGCETTSVGNVCVTKKGTFNMYGGTITKCTSGRNGNVYLEDYSTFNMHGGSITGNSIIVGSTDVGGGAGIYVTTHSIFNMYGGAISNNKTLNDSYGGGIYLSTVAYANIYGGSITGNSAKRGAGIYCSSKGYVTMTGGTISGNIAADKGNGIFYSSNEGAEAELYIGGSPNIADDIYLDSTKDSKYPFITSVIKNKLTLTLSNPFDGRIVAQGKDYTLTTADLARITLQAGDTPYYAVLKDTTNQIIMSLENPGYTMNHYVKYHANGGQGTTEDNTPYAQGTEAEVKANAFTRTGWTFNGWNTQADGNGTSYAAGSKITVNEDVDLYAIWTKAATEETYKVETGVSTNGTLSVSANSAKAGDVITVTVTPNSGYKCTGIEVKTASGASVTVTPVSRAVASSQWTFNMPAENVTVTASYEAEAVYYTVIYKADGVQVGETQTVVSGGDAVAPEIPAKTGYDKTAPYWDKDGKNITEDTVINAVYTINTYTVIFKADGKEVDKQTVNHGADAVAPKIPEKTGYSGKWSYESKNVTQDMVIEAVYSQNPFTGDSSNIYGMSVVMVVSLVAAVVLLVFGKKFLYDGKYSNK